MPVNVTLCMVSNIFLPPPTTRSTVDSEAFCAARCAARNRATLCSGVSPAIRCSFADAGFDCACGVVGVKRVASATVLGSILDVIWSAIEAKLVLQRLGVLAEASGNFRERFLIDFLACSMLPLRRMTGGPDYCRSAPENFMPGGEDLVCPTSQNACGQVRTSRVGFLCPPEKFGAAEPPRFRTSKPRLRKNITNSSIVFGRNQSQWYVIRLSLYG